MKKKKILRGASALLVLTLVAVCAVSGTFAKYISAASGSDTATVAKWSFKAMGREIAVVGAAPTLTFDLFDTVNDTGNAAAETDVAPGKIAPGTAGSFAMKVQNTSEVTAKYTIALEETNDSDIPLQYSLDGTAWVDSVAELAVTGLTDQTLAIGAGEVSHTIYWRWAFEGTDAGAHTNQTDAADTALGIAAQTAAPAVTVTATVTATQVD